ncbi:hypothetical protein AB0L64_39995 [Kribbella sp. NPDC051936]|uniref:hypothetical protein n=1 Tax=Kribbella sp. NPDC051936 TaxID=3154946 RepID=UPI003445CCA8
MEAELPESGLTYRLDGWMPQRTGLPMDVVVVGQEGVRAWLFPRRIDVPMGYNIEGIVDRATVVVPEREVGGVLEALPTAIGISTVGLIAGKGALLQIRAPAPLSIWNVSALGELLTRDQLALVLTDLGRAVSPFALRGELLAELLEMLPPAAARHCVLAAIVSI